MASRTFRRVPRWLTFAAFGAMLLALLAPAAIPAPPRSRLAHTQPRPQLAISPASARTGATITRTITGREWPANSTVTIDIRSGDALVAQRTVNTNDEGQFNGAISTDAAKTPGVALVVEARSDQAASSTVALAVNAADPTPTPSPADPSPAPSPADPTPTPSPADPTPTPSPADPTPTPSPADPTPTPSPADPTPTPPPPTPTPAPPPPTPTPAPPPTPTPPPPTPTPPPAPPTPTPPPPAPTPAPPTPTPPPPAPTPAPPTPAPPSPTQRPPATQPPTVQPPGTPRPSAPPVCALSRDRALAGIYVLATCSRFPVGHSIRVVWPNGRTLTAVPFPADPQTFSFQVPVDAKTGAYIVRFVDASDSSIQAAASIAVTAISPGAQPPPTQPPPPAPPGAPKHNVVVFLGGVCTGLGAGVSPVISSQVAEGQQLDFSDNQQATFHYLQQALRQRHGYSDSDFLAYSYNGGIVDGGGVWRHRPYLPTDPIQNDLDQSVENLHSLLDQYSRAHPNTRFILVGHSLGGLVAFQELNYVASTDYAKGAISISTIITVDSPLAGLTQDTFSASKALNLALPNKVDDCAAGAFYDMQDTAIGQRLLDMNRASSDTTQANEQLVAAARGQGVRVVNVGNTRDCLYAPGVCTYPLPLTQGDIDTQWIPNSAAEAQAVVNSAGCITVFHAITTACAGKTHSAALNGEIDPGAVTAIANAIGPMNPPQKP